ncbi:MAG TPA: hypothetical protein VFO39_12710 [Candidatus Sulfotelmatobacter sp.]|nr:hypothetical protein [Candidatus Sulfotelmatobacter sp.]
MAAKDGRDILEVLKFELSFLEDGGYGRSPQTPWRPPSIFEDSPICPNFSDPARPHACDSCLLIDFVPQDRREDVVPCRFIQICREGRTVEDFYRTGTQVEMEEALGRWLREQISKIEQERGLAKPGGTA